VPETRNHLIMIDKPRKLSATARAVLTSAAARDDHLIRPPRLPIAAARQVVRSLLQAGLADEVPAPIEDAGYAWRTGEDGEVLMLRATLLGLARVSEGEAAAVAPVSFRTVAETVVRTAGTDTGGLVTGVAPPTGDLPAKAAQPAWEGRDHASRVETPPTSFHAVEAPKAAFTLPGRTGRPDSVRQAAQALLKAWDECAGSDADTVDIMNGPFARLRAALAMLRRDEGASGPQIAEAMGWAPHTVRGFLAGLAKKGINVEVLERVRQVGPNKASAKGSYTVYHLARETRS